MSRGVLGRRQRTNTVLEAGRMNTEDKTRCVA